jgi:polygalacturonase
MAKITKLSGWLKCPSWLKRPCGCVNVRAYGAKGDGKTDDAAAIQTAIDALTSGGVVFFPSGVYRVESTVKLKSNVRLIGVGIDATVVKAGDSYITEYDVCGDAI